MPTMRQLTLICLLPALTFAQTGGLGIFTNSGDVGDPAVKGSADYSNGQYRITGAGANMWAKQDQFQYAWREIPGNFTVTATLRFLGEGNEHRKAGIVVRQSIDTDSAYAHVAIHGNGMRRTLICTRSCSASEVSGDSLGSPVISSSEMSYMPDQRSVSTSRSSEIAGCARRGASRPSARITRPATTTAA